MNAGVVRIFEPLEPRLLLGGGPLVISEFMASNADTLADQDGDYPDWIEIHNPTENSLDLDGWHLSDDADDLSRWEFPSVVLETGGYLVVFASGKDRRAAASGPLHTNFKLNAGGEDLLLVQPDGRTVSHAYRDYPPQFEDLSYGVTQDVALLVAEGILLSYLVPTGDDAAMAAAWMAADFDDSAWTGGEPPSPVLITEAGTITPDYVEIQNVSADAVDTSGWVVAVNNATDGIGAVHSILWELPDRIAAEEVLYRTDDPQDNYWGEGINWRTTRSGWVMLVDDHGEVADFVAWGYQAAEIAALEVPVNGHDVSVGDAWTGAAALPNDDSSKALQRNGNADRNGAVDFFFTEPQSMGLANPGMTLPFPGGPTTGIGFGTDAGGLAGAVRTDVEDAMRHVNASLWTRFSFEIDDPAELESLQLRVKYNDGYVAYLNGQEVARRNAPGSPSWDSAATNSRSAAESLLYEGINLDDFLSALQPGRNVLAVHGLNDAAADAEFLVLPELVGLYDSDMVIEGYYVVATPGAANDGEAMVTGPVISHVATSPLRPAANENLVVAASVTSQRSDVDQVTLRYRVMYRNEIEVTMSDDGQGADVVADDGVYTAVIPAAAYGPGQMVRWLVAATDADAGQWRSPPFLDPEDSPEYFGTVVADPSISTALPVFHRFIANTPAAETGRGTRASVYYLGEFYDNVFIRIRGGTARNWAKKSYKIKFNENQHFRFREDVPRVDEMNVNAMYTDKSYVRSVLTSEMQLDAGTPSPETFHVRMHQNGEFFSVAMFVEQPDRDFLRRHDMDPNGALYKAEPGSDSRLNAGTSSLVKQTRLGEDKSDLEALIAGLKLTGDDLTDFLFDNVNLPAQINFMATNVVTQNIDATDKNYYIYRDTEGSGEWHMMPWDLDLTFGPDALNTDRMVADETAYTTGAANPNAVHPLLGRREYPLHTGSGKYNDLMDRIFDVPRTREMFLRRVRTLTDEFLATEYVSDRIDELVALLLPDFALDQARWGANAHFGSVDYTLQQATQRIRDEYLAPRLPYLTEYHAPGANAGSVGIPDAQPADPWVEFGTIEYNPASGNQDEEYLELLNPNATAVDLSGWRLTGGVTATFQAGTVIPAGDTLYVSPDVTAFRARPTAPRGGMSLLVQGYDRHLSNFGETIVLLAPDGEVVAEVTYPGDPSPQQRHLRITEINYHPHGADPTIGQQDVDPDEFEFIELLNADKDQALDLTGVRFTDGIAFSFTGSDVTSLAPGQRVLVVKNRLAFQSRYGQGLNVAGEYVGGLRNSGEAIKLEDANNGTIAQFDYGDGDPWPGRADGKGGSLEVIDPAGDYGDPENWRSSSEFGGSPGAQGDGPLVDVLINEVLSRSPLPLVDWIELVNTTDGAIDVGGWYLSDSWGWDWAEDNGNYKKYRIPDGTTIAAHGYLVFDETQLNPSGGIDPENHPYDFALNGIDGDDVWLTKADAAGNLTHFADHVKFGAADNGESFGRWPDAQGDLYPASARTPGERNSGPRVGPVVISEVHYNPGSLAAAGDLEFIEIYNPTGTAVDLTEWRIREGVDFDFASGTQLAAGGVLVVLPFDPQDEAEAAKWSAFCTRYGLDPSLTDGFAGGYLGQLSNGGDTIRLQRGADPPPGTVVIPRLLEDEVHYEDTAPWPAEADGSGKSLVRLGASLWGNDPNSWSAAAATPGAVRLPAEVTGRHVFYNHSAFDRPMFGLSDDDAIAPDKAAFLPGKTATFANYTSYVRGINGVMIDVAGLPEAAQLDSSSDFRFQVGNDEDPGQWPDAPAPQSVVLRRRAGVNGADRVVIVWADHAIANRWLRVTFRATAHTALAEDDVFYFGNAVGEAGDSTLHAAVNATDEIAARNFQHGPTNLATIDDPYDYNRDGLVNTTDRTIARNNQTGPADMLRLISVPAVDAVLEEAGQQLQ